MLLIAFSGVSEAIFSASALPSDAFVDSIIGSLVAIVIAAAVILQFGDADDPSVHSAQLAPSQGRPRLS